MHARELFICLANAVFVAGDKLVMVPATFEPPIRAKTEENQKSAWREDHILFPEPVVPEQKTGIVSVAESHPVDVKAASRAGRRLQASCPSPPPPAPVFIPAYCPAYPALPLLNSTMGFSGIPSIPSLLPGQQNATTGTFIDSGGVFEWTSGCPVVINLGSGETLYTKVYLPPRWKLEYAWETSQPFIMFPDFHQIPYYLDNGLNTNVPVDDQEDSYLYYGNLNSEHAFQPIPATFRDIYHRTAGWVRAAKGPRRSCCTMRCSLLAF